MFEEPPDQNRISSACSSSAECSKEGRDDSEFLETVSATAGSGLSSIGTS